MVSHWVWCAVGAATVIVLIILIKVVAAVLPGIVRRRRDKKWKRLTKNSETLILHCPIQAKTMPSMSPFVMKVSAFLRMAGIPYEVDHTTPFGGKGKTPWISLAGQNLADSEFIIEFLSKKFGKNLHGPYSEEQLASATAVRIMLEEHFFWGMATERIVYGSAHNLNQVMEIPAIIRFVAKKLIKGRIMAQGIGEHSNEEIIAIMTNNLLAVSRILGGKKFILGDEPCVHDAGIFGQLSQCCWGLPNSPYERLVNGECKNLKEYCERIKKEFYPEWK